MDVWALTMEARMTSVIVVLALLATPYGGFAQVIAAESRGDAAVAKAVQATRETLREDLSRVAIAPRTPDAGLQAFLAARSAELRAQVYRQESDVVQCYVGCRFLEPVDGVLIPTLYEQGEARAVVYVAVYQRRADDPEILRFHVDEVTLGRGDVGGRWVVLGIRTAVTG